jgi:hypothetical protein
LPEGILTPLFIIPEACEEERIRGKRKEEEEKAEGWKKELKKERKNRKDKETDWEEMNRNE